MLGGGIAGDIVDGAIGAALALLSRNDLCSAAGSPGPRQARTITPSQPSSSPHAQPLRFFPSPILWPTKTAPAQDKNGMRYNICETIGAAMRKRHHSIEGAR